MPAAPSLVNAWDDPVSLETVLHREPYVQKRVGPVSPGTSPRGAQLLTRYREYTRLDDWEAMNKGLNKEVVPVKRQAISDYLRTPAAGESRSPAAAAATAPALGGEMAAEAFAPEQPPASARWSASAGSSTRVAGRMCVGLPSPRAAAAAEAAEAAGAPAAGTAAAAAEPLQEPLTAAALAAAGLADDAPRPARARAKPRPFRAVPEPEVSPRVQKIEASQVGMDSPRRQARQHGGPRVADRERVLYSNAKDMRASRKLNLQSKKRLNELLGAPGPRIEATDRHPSRSCGVVPSQNVRIA